VRSTFAAVQRQAVLVVVATLVTGVVAWAVAAARSPLYEARVELVLQPPAADTVVPTEVQVASSQEVRALAAKALGPSPRVTARPIPGSNAILLTARAGSPHEAQAAAKGFADAYAGYRRTGAGADLQASEAEVAAELARLQGRIDRATGAERAALQEQYQVFAGVQAQLEVDAASVQDRVRVVSPVAAVSNVRMAPATVAGWGAVVGLVLGVDLALIFDALDAERETAVTT